MLVRLAAPLPAAAGELFDAACEFKYREFGDDLIDRESAASNNSPAAAGSGAASGTSRFSAPRYVRHYPQHVIRRRLPIVGIQRIHANCPMCWVLP